MQKRRVEQDKYMQERQIAEKELQDKEHELTSREQAVVAREDEFAGLQLRVANFEGEIAGKITAAEDALAKTLQQEFKFTQTLKDEQAKRGIDLLQQKIESLQEKIAEQVEIITSLNNRLALSQEQSQQIAHKALETSIQRNVIINPNEQRSQN